MPEGKKTFTVIPLVTVTSVSSARQQKWDGEAGREGENESLDSF